MFLKELFRKTTETNVLILPGRREVKEDKQTNKQTAPGHYALIHFILTERRTCSSIASLLKVSFEANLCSQWCLTKKREHSWEWYTIHCRN